VSIRLEMACHDTNEWDSFLSSTSATPLLCSCSSLEWITVWSSISNRPLPSKWISVRPAKLIRYLLSAWQMASVFCAPCFCLKLSQKAVQCLFTQPFSHHRDLAVYSLPTIGYCQLLYHTEVHCRFRRTVSSASQFTQSRVLSLPVHGHCRLLVHLVQWASPRPL